MFILSLLSSAFGIRLGAFGFVFHFFGVLLPPRFGHPAAFVEELSNDDDIEPRDPLGHPHPVDFDVGREVFPAPDGVIVDRPIVGDGESNHHRLGDLFLPGFSRRPLPILFRLLP